MTKTHRRTFTQFAGALALVVLAGCSAMQSGMNTVSGVFGSVKLTGEQEVPPVVTSAKGSAKIDVTPEGSVSGSVATEGLDGTMAHIHLGAVGKNGPIIIPLTKTGDGTWTVPGGAKLNADQLKAYQAGDLYVNVHTAANRGGEIRAQLKP